MKIGLKHDGRGVLQEAGSLPMLVGERPVQIVHLNDVVGDVRWQKWIVWQRAELQEVRKLQR